MEKSLYELREDYQLGARADRSSQHEVIFAVEQRNLDKLEALLYEVKSTNFF
jgi:hypothetical protein